MSLSPSHHALERDETKRTCHGTNTACEQRVSEPVIREKKLPPFVEHISSTCGSHSAASEKVPMYLSSDAASASAMSIALCVAYCCTNSFTCAEWPQGEETLGKVHFSSVNRIVVGVFSKIRHPHGKVSFSSRYPPLPTWEIQRYGLLIWNPQHVTNTDRLHVMHQAFHASNSANPVYSLQSQHRMHTRKDKWWVCMTIPWHCILPVRSLAVLPPSHRETAHIAAMVDIQN